MQLNYLAFAIPLFLFFIGLEYFHSRRHNRNLFGYAESIANLNVGIAERLLDIFTTGLFFYAFVFMHKHFALFVIKPNVLTWILLFLATDLVWYWYHRFAHEINAFWAVHVVHHQSEDFNYTVSARITVFQAAVRCMFWCVLPIIGFPPLMVAALLLVHGLYPFFIHTQTLGKWGWFEKVLVTPTHHALHHASNPEYLDKNYGDVLIIWDKLFGTFVKEQKEVEITYGLTKQLNSHSFLWQHFHYPLEIFMNFRAARGFKARWRVIFGRPDDLDPRYRAVLERKLLKGAANRKPAPTFLIRQYVTAQTIFSLSLLFLVVLLEHYLTAYQLLIFSLIILVSLVNSGAMLEQRRYIIYLELTRVVLLMFAVTAFYPDVRLFSGIAVALLLMTMYFRHIRRHYFRFIYAHEYGSGTSSK